MTLPLWLQILTLAAPAAVAVFSAVWASRSAYRAQQAESDAARLRALEERTAQKKYELYQPFVGLLNDLLTPSRNAMATAASEDVIVNFQGFVTMWGSDEVVEMFFRWRSSAATDPPAMVAMRLMSDLLLAIRRDVAWPDTKVPGAHIIGMRINDLPDHPEMTDALSLPLDEFLATQDWTPPFEVPSHNVAR
jgi:hypothetical protein